MQSNGDLTLWAIMAVVGGLTLFVKGFRELKFKRIVQNTPTCKINTGAVGTNVEIKARVADAEEVLRFPQLEIRPQRQEVRVDGEPVSLTPTEFQILLSLARAPKRVFNRAQLVERAFGPHFEGFDRTVDAHVKNLRRKIETDRTQPAFIVTVFGVGYRFEGGGDAA